MVHVDMSLMPPKVIGGRLVYELKVILGYQRILDPKGIQTFMEGGVKRNKGFYEGGRWRCAL
jgi:hypothetical protein